MRGWPILVTALVVSAASAAAECATTGTARAVVAEAIDGATLRLTDGGEVRLAGIEAPAPPLVLPADAPWSMGEAARAGLARLAAGVAVSLVEAG